MKVQQQFVMCANANAPSLPLSLSPSFPLRFEVEVARARRAPYLASQDEREREENSKLLARSFEAGFLAILAAKKRKRKRAERTTTTTMMIASNAVRKRAFLRLYCLCPPDGRPVCLTAPRAGMAAND